MNSQYKQHYKDILDWAIAYAESQFNIIPLLPHDSESKGAGKSPLLKGWQSRDLPTLEEVKGWYKRWPKANIGLVLGLKSGVIAIDVDGEKGEGFLQELSHGDLPDTCEFTTPGGGRRLLYRLPEGYTLKKYVKSDPSSPHQECSLMGEGQQTVLPPSVHPNGKLYEWIDGKGPDQIEVAAAPEWMVTLMSRKEKLSTIKQNNNQEKVLAKLAEKCPLFSENLAIQKESGVDYDTWFRTISLLNHAGYPEAAHYFSALSTKHDDNSEKVLADLVAKEGQVGLVRCTTFGCDEVEINKCFQGKIRSNDSQEITNSPGAFLLTKANPNLEAIGITLDPETGKIKDFNPNIFVRHILENIQLLMTDGERFYTYDDGLWSYLELNDLCRILRDFLHQHKPDIWTPTLENKYLPALKLEVKKIKETDCDKDQINLINGTFDLATYELKTHDPQYYSTVRIPIVYDPQAKCPLFLNFLHEVFENDEERIAVIGEILGYSLTAETRGQKAFFLYGTGSNGKSVLAQVIVELCGKANVSTVSLRELNNSFARYELIGKTVNLTTENELDENGLNTQYFKSIVTGDPIRVEKKHGEGFSYQPICKLVFCINNLPYSRDRSHGFTRRLIIIPFNRQFTDEEADKMLPEKLKEELPGIFNFALEGLKRLRENNYNFSYSEEVAKALAEYKAELNPIVDFIDQCVKVASEVDRSSKKEIHSKFKLWCIRNGYRKTADISTKRFWKSFESILIERKIPLIIKKSNGVDYLMGIQLNTEEEEDILDDIP